MDNAEYLRRMKRCSVEQMDLKILLDEFTYLIINDIHNSSNLPLSYVFLSMVVALCHWTYDSYLKGVNYYNIPLILFGILCGGSGSKKSAPIRIVKEACEQVEAFIGIPLAKSSLNNSATMESVCMELQNKSHLLQLWDELAIFLGLFGSTRSDRASYDRGIMCELYNPTGVVRRQLVSRTNIMVKPRLCILAAGHPRETINCLTGSGFKTAEINDDGLFNRFLISVGYKQKPHRDCPPPDNKIPKLAHLFFYTHQLHKQTREYSFNEEDVDVDGIPQSDIDHIKSYIKNHPSERILLSTLPSNLKRKYTKEQYLPILQQLEADGHGIVTTTENTTGPKAICFAKKPRIEQPSESQNLIASSRS
ncbi:unnamed protein product [Rotaria sp. Silwood1]|nr:unnamed protein product [Rotaria sp. Silwood1]CAF3840438.1 unnamed protein product [Rotaria sp. Silwood1]